jgi:hypothetical protein
MERGVLLTMRRALQLLVLLLLSAQACAASHTLVLVVRTDSKVADFDSLTIRKLFLGLPVLVDGTPLHPVRNRTDPELDPIFLQQIVAMSQSAYERQILVGVNRHGWLRPLEIGDPGKLLQTLYSDPNAVTFMWLNDVEHDPKLRVIRVLWSE